VAAVCCLVPKKLPSFWLLLLTLDDLVG